MSDDLLKALVALSIPNLPFYLIWLVGLVLAFVSWRRHPKVSLLLVIAFSLLLLDSLGETFVHSLVWVRMRELRWTPEQVDPYLAALRIAGFIIQAGAWALVLSAAVGWRGRRLAPQAVAWPPDRGHPPDTAFRVDRPM